MPPAAADLIQTSLLGEAIDAGPVGVMVADDEMRYVAVNQYICDLLGYSREELLELSVADVCPFPETPGRYVSMMVGELAAGTNPVRRKDGTEIEMFFRAGQTRVAGLTFYISAIWPLSEG